MRVLVCGGRNYGDAARVRAVLDDILVTAIVEGCAPGADSLAEEYAKRRRIANEHYPADWKRYGASAGPRRNRLMLIDGKPDLVVAFPGGPGTANMVALAIDAGIRVVEVME